MPPFETYFERSINLSEAVLKAADQIDHQRRIPSQIVDHLIDQGFFRLLLPRSIGGEELDHPDFLKIVRVFAEADASVAWCINQNNVFSTNAARLGKDAAMEVWGNSRTVVAAGAGGSECTAVRHGDGYLLSGTWRFNSGIRHCNWVAGRIRPTNSEGPEASQPLDFLLPKSDVKIIDDWQVGGLRGTGSLSFEVDEVFVPAERSYDPTEPPRELGPLYVIDTTPLFASGFANVALGAARAAMNSAIDLAKHKTQQGSTAELLREVPTQRMIGQAEAIWSSANAFLQEAVQEMWDSASYKRDLDTKTRIRVRLASTHAIRQAAEAIDIAYTICGSTAIFESNPIQRRFQDVHAITQQIQGRPTHYDTVGQFHLGLEPKGVF